MVPTNLGAWAETVATALIGGLLTGIAYSLMQASWTWHGLIGSGVGGAAVSVMALVRESPFNKAVDKTGAAEAASGSESDEVRKA